METACIKTPLGTVTIVGDTYGVSVISVSGENDSKVTLEPLQKISTLTPMVLQEAVLQLQDYFRNERTEFTFKIKPKGTDFQQKVWKELLNIPFGKTISYLDLAKRLGDIKAIRAVASANGKNPLWIAIPCHRVIGTDGSLTGYAGGLWRKKWLLEHENPTNQGILF